MRIDMPLDPRLNPLVALRRYLPVPQFDLEEREDRKLLRRITIREAVRGDQ